jgi:hypothetical protein
MPTTVRERVQRHRQITRATGFVRVDVELPRHLISVLRRDNESLKDLMLRALNALKEHVSGNVTGNKPRRNVLPETFPETRQPNSSTCGTRGSRPRTLPSGWALPTGLRNHGPISCNGGAWSKSGRVAGIIPAVEPRPAQRNRTHS